MSRKIDSIVIVGGGTSGWLTAAYLARRLGANRPDGVKITLVEASDIATIGVGEGTFPSLRTTMATIGVDEGEFMRDSACTFKQGIKFVDWERSPSSGEPRHYYHLFNYPRQMGGGIDLAPYWLMGGAREGVSFAEAVALQELVCERRLAPKRLTDDPYSGPMNYAYHFDAGRFAQFLKRTALALGVAHVIGRVETATRDEAGAIASLLLADERELSAALYIDCSGFIGALIMKTFGAPRRVLNDMLFVDRALAIQVPYASESEPIASATISTAAEAGWIWDIGLDTRRGVGYVFSSRHTDGARAEEVLRGYLGAAGKDREVRLLKMPTGYCLTPWVKNCVGVGLAGGFLEPLEATSIAMCEAAIRLIADYFPRDGDMAPVARLFNRAMGERYEGAVDFIKMHYYLTKRRDTEFWIENAQPETAPERLREKLRLWKTRPPTSSDIASVHEMFRTESYQYVLFGMGFRPDLSGNLSSYPYTEEASAEFARVGAAAKRAAAAMPDHRSLLTKAYKGGFSAPTRVSVDAASGAEAS